MCDSRIILSSDHTIPFGNIMYDRRVIRGSTFAAPPALVSILYLIVKKEVFGSFSFFFYVVNIIDRWRTIDSGKASGSKKEASSKKKGASSNLQSYKIGIATTSRWSQTRTGPNWILSRRSKRKKDFIKRYQTNVHSYSREKEYINSL